MKKVDRWLLPDAIEEMLPEQASQVEDLRRRLVNLFKSWGYDYVIPPMLEFTDSLLAGSDDDIGLLTFKLTDQLSGKMLGLRADITPQVARMDAHSLKRDGINRLCYAGHVAHTKPKGPLVSRTPIQVGIELFGEAGADADIEVISLLIATLEQAGLPEQYVDLGHVGVFRALSKCAGLSCEQEGALFDLMQVKAFSEIESWLEAELSDAQQRRWFLKLPQFAGSIAVLDEALDFYADAPAAVSDAIAELKAVATTLVSRFPEARLYFDLSELRGYHYLTGIVFGASSPGVGASIATGGRYDHIGEVFGRSRPATGFAVDLTVVREQVKAELVEQNAIFAPQVDSPAYWAEVQALRASGERVICGLGGQAEAFSHQGCNRILQEHNGGFRVNFIETSKNEPSQEK
ncbi:ATP phosphoribosyltransferase regulatory subunit [Agaribacterium haliotis]|uniref:ATP phosphoribosyltransferase regulatory subunit n=1 Tax=Agaribacterium haliotis TaxID=2013869 RepID=UPI000BB55105|nr:ATP phosphoribosyltransferase regulatory subunit [Agaribacterium haliotis]